mgnify:FL=1
MEYYMQVLLNSIITGGIYGLIAVGYSMIYSILRFVNFSHGFVAMMGMYFTYALSVQLNLPFYIAVVGGIILTSLLGMLIERVAYRPLRDSFYLAPLVAVVGVAFFLESVALMVWGGGILSYDITTTSYSFWGLYITNVQIGILITLLVTVVSLFYLIEKTTIGQAIRATADDIKMASLVGINSNRIVVVVFVLGSALAAVGGTFLGLETNLQPTIGLSVTAKSFAAVILGGFGNIYGGLVGGLVLGFAENFGVTILPTVWKDFIAFGVLFIVIYFKPSGLLAKRQERGGRYR